MPLKLLSRSFFAKKQSVDNKNLATKLSAEKNLEILIMVDFAS